MSETRTEALIAAASTAYAALSAASCRDAESVSADSETERECEAAMEQIRAALAHWSYMPCYSCGTPTLDVTMVSRRLNNGQIARDCPSCIEFIGDLRDAAWHGLPPMLPSMPPPSPEARDDDA